MLPAAQTTTSRGSLTPVDGADHLGLRRQWLVPERVRGLDLVVPGARELVCALAVVVAHRPVRERGRESLDARPRVGDEALPGVLARIRR